MVAVAEEDALGAKTGLSKAVVFDEERVQPEDFRKGQGILAGLENGLAPSLEAAARRSLALYLEAGAAVGEQQKAGGARENVRPGLANCVLGLTR